MSPGVRLLAVTVSGLLLASLAVIYKIVEPLQHLDYDLTISWLIFMTLAWINAYAFGRVGTGRERNWNYLRVHTISFGAWALGIAASTLVFLGPTATLYWGNVVLLVVSMLMIMIPARQFWRSIVAQEQQNLSSNATNDK